MFRSLLLLSLVGVWVGGCSPKKAGDASGGDGGSTAGGGGTGSGNTATQPGSNLPTGSPRTGQLTGPQTRYIGRVRQLSQYGALMAWPGTGAQLSFTGAKISLGMTGVMPSQANMVDVYVDATLVKTIALSDSQPNNLYPIDVPGGDSGLHTVTVLKRTEPNFGEILFQGASVTGTLSANTLARPGRLIEFIGDNVTAGYGVEGPVGNNASCPLAGSVYPTNPAFTNVNLAYPVLTARTLSADWSVVAYSARGVAYNLSGATGGTLPQLWQMQDPIDVDNGLWGFQPAPDVVVINAGTSDINYWYFNSGKPPIDKAGFTATYAGWLGQIRQKYANAQIIATLGPMLSQYTCPKDFTLSAGAGACTGADGSAQASALALGRELVQAAIAKVNDSKVTYLEFPADSTNVSCDYHPDKVGQQNIANLLVPAIRKAAGWN